MNESKSFTAYNVQAASVVGDDFSYVTIAVTWKGKKYLEKPTECEKTQVMWSHDGPFGVVGSKVGDFIGCYGVDSFYGQEGVFTHRHIARSLMETFTGLKYNELEWHENPLEKVLASGKPRSKKAKWLPEKPVDLVHLYSDNYVDVNNPPPIETDFFTAFRWNDNSNTKNPWRANWFMCSDETAAKLKEMGFTCLTIERRSIKIGPR